MKDHRRQHEDERVLHADPIDAVVHQNDEIFYPDEGGLLVAQTGELEETQAKYLEAVDRAITIMRKMMAGAIIR